MKHLTKIQDAGPAIDLIAVPGGSFVMGATEHDKFATMIERPAHEVHIKPLHIARTPVTVSQWNAYAQDARLDWWPIVRAGQRDDWPVMGVSWDDAAGFIRWLKDKTGRAFRLMSESEWEYAARAGTHTVFHTGDVIELEQANYLYGEQGQLIGKGTPTPVGAYPPNALGLCDMLGSVLEWTADTWHTTYEGAPADGSPWVDEREARRVVRGGSWDYLPRLLRCAWRDAIPRDQRLDNVGFRVCLSE